MSYLVKRLSGESMVPVRPGHAVNFKSGQTRWVDEESIQFILENPSVFSVLDGPDLTILSAAADGVETAISGAGGIGAAYIDFNDTAEAEMTITIGGIVYTEADEADEANGIFTNGASAADSAASLIAAINGDTRTAVPFVAVADVSGDGVWIFYKTAGVAGNITISTDSAANCTVSESATGGAAVEDGKIFKIVHTVTANELLSGAVEIPLPFVPTALLIQAFTATGAPVYFTDLVTVELDPDRIRIATNGATNLADTDVVHIIAA